MSSDVDKLVEVLQRNFPTVPPPADEIWSHPPAVKVIDCVLSLNRPYDKVVLPRIQRFVKDHPSVKELPQLKQLINSYATPSEFSTAVLTYNDSGRAVTVAGVVDYLLQVQTAYEGATEEERLVKWAAAAKPSDYLNVGVRGFGLAGFQYLRMLFGAQTTKPDVHVIGYVSKALGRKVANLQALVLLEEAAKRASLPVRELDIAIWEASAPSRRQSPDKA